MRILVVRNDKLGDFMLAWPVFSLLKQYWPEAHVSALVPRYTAPMAGQCPWIDEIVIDHRKTGTLSDILALQRQLRNGDYDALLTLFSSGRVAVAGCLAGIPYRLTPATKLAQFCYNHRLAQRRSRSEKPEYAYNLDLAYQLLRDLKKIPLARSSGSSADNDSFFPTELNRPLLQFEVGEIAQLRENFCAQHQLEPNAQVVFIHPGSGGSANNLSLDQYAQLAHSLENRQPLVFVISAGPGEEQVAEALRKKLKPLPATVLHPTDGLDDFARHLQFANLFISGSTGPLHIAAALDRQTAAFYPRHRSATPLRWQTLNAPDKRLAFVPPSHEDEKDMASIDVVAAAREISQRFLK